MPPFNPYAYEFGLAASLDKIPGVSTVNKYGQAPDCDNGDPTDVWSGADAVTGTKIWVAPTVARTHVIASSSGDDAVAGSGVQMMRLYGLTTWDTEEETEDVSVGDTTNKSWVIIYRIKCLTFGAGLTNAGIIKATATTDGTVTAVIQAGEGQTQMAIYAIPSTKVLRICNMRSEILGAAATAGGIFHLLIKENVNLATSGFIHKEDAQFTRDAPFDRFYPLPKKVNGPAIIKAQVVATTANSNVTGSIDGFVMQK